MASVRIPSLLALEAGGVRRHDVDAATVREAIQALPVADLLIDELGQLRPLLHIYVQGHREPDLEAPLAPNADLIVVAAVAGGSRAPGRRRLPPGEARLRHRLAPVAAPGSPGLD